MMSNLVQVGKHTYYFDGPSRVGVIVSGANDGRDVWLVDSGNCTQCGRDIIAAFAERDWHLQAIINTHGHADHIGGNRVLQEHFGCPVLAAGEDVCFINNPILAPTYMFGGFAIRDLRNRFLQAEPSECQALRNEQLPAGCQTVRLDGHSFAMSAVRSPDGVWFIGDAVFDPSVTEKYHVPYVQNVEKYLQSLPVLQALEGELFIASHMEPFREIDAAVAFSRALVEEILEYLVTVCREAHTFDEIVTIVFNHYSMRLSVLQYALAGSSLRSFLGCLRERGTLALSVTGNSLRWVVG